MTQSGFTYLLSNGEAYKIGMTTRSVQSRCKELASASGVYIEPWPIAYCLNNDCYGLEKKLHALYDIARINKDREWFYLNEKQIEEIITIFTEKHIGIDNLLPDVSIEYKAYTQDYQKLTIFSYDIMNFDEFKEALEDCNTYEEAKDRAIHLANVLLEARAEVKARAEAEAEAEAEARAEARARAEAEAEARAEAKDKAEVRENRINLAIGIGLLVMYFSILAWQN